MDARQKPQTAKRAKKHAATAPALEATRDSVANAVQPTVPGPALIADGESDPGRREKIEKIKQALADGTYRIDNDAVARKLIDHMREPKR